MKLKWMTALAATIFATFIVAPVQATTAQGATSDQPNIVFIMLDDISHGYMDAMPHVSNLILDQGTRYPNAIAPTSLCCPSRASTLTGNYAHTTGVYGNQDVNGGWATFKHDEGSTIATHLNAVGYHTALVGKYLNGYSQAPAGYTPAGWDDFIGFKNLGYYNWSVNGTVQAKYGDAPEDYSTDVLSDYAVQQVNDTPADQPLFLYYSPYAAHRPYVPSPKYEGTWHTEPLYGAFNEANMHDKPKFMQEKPLIDQARMEAAQQAKHEMLMSADDGVQRIYDALGSRVDNTLFVLMSDNGYMLGDHRIEPKDMPYQHAAGIEMALRWDNHIYPGVSDRVTTNTDLTATIAEAAGVSWQNEGRSVLSQNRQGTVLEQMSSIDSQGADGADVDKSHPAYCGYRTADWLYVKWNGVAKEELYRYSTDPDELTNLAGKAQWQAKRLEMKQQAKDKCTPMPPGFSWADSKKARSKTTVASYLLNERPKQTVLHDSSNYLNGTIGENIVRNGQNQVFPWVSNGTHGELPGRIDQVPDDPAFNLSGKWSVSADFLWTHGASDRNIVQKGQGTPKGGVFKMKTQVNWQTGARTIWCYIRGAKNGSSVYGWAAKHRLDDGKWHTVTCSSVGSKGTKMVIDGVVVDRNSKVPGLIDNDFPLTIGGNVSCPSIGGHLGSCNYWSGSIDNIVIKES